MITEQTTFVPPDEVTSLEPLKSSEKSINLPIQTPPPDTTAQITPGQARIEAVAASLAKAYENASLLKLTPDEAKALSEDFPDDAFSLGAGGDPNLVYIEHAYLRQRLNNVLGVGAAIPIRRREWAEDGWYYKDGKRLPLVRVYVDLVLMVRGAVVGEAIGDAVYYPSNPKTNYSDALESAKSNAFRRCCKEFGVGLQAWMRGWCDGWKQRNSGKTIQKPQPPLKIVKPNQPPKPEEKPLATVEQQKRFLALLEPIKESAEAYFRDIAWLLPNESLSELPAVHFPTTKHEADKIISAIRDFTQVFDKLADTDTKPPEQKPETLWWRDIIVPIPPAGVKRSDYMKAPETLGLLFDRRHDQDETARRRLWGLVTHFEPSRTWTGSDGKEHTRSEQEYETDLQFRKALDACKEYSDSHKICDG